MNEPICSVTVQQRATCHSTAACHVSQYNSKSRVTVQQRVTCHSTAACHVSQYRSVSRVDAVILIDVYCGSFPHKQRRKQGSNTFSFSIHSRTSTTSNILYVATSVPASTAILSPFIHLVIDKRVKFFLYFFGTKTRLFILPLIDIVFSPESHPW